MQTELFETGITNQDRRFKICVPAPLQAMRTCEWCGVLYQPTKGAKHQRFCSPQHASSAEHARGISQTFICKGCGIEFKPTRSDRIKFHSRECAFKYGFLSPDERAQKDKFNEIKKLLHVIVNIKKCRICGAKTLNIYCSVQCAKIEARRKSYERSKSEYNKQINARKCRECNIEFTPTYGIKYRIFCSDFCCLKHNGRIGKSKRRAKIKTSKIESIDPIEIFKRDGWRCQLCGVKTPMRLRGKLECNSPEMDHIIPLAAGGQHTKLNVQCCCRQCNIRKSAKSLGQLRLA